MSEKFKQFVKEQNENFKSKNSHGGKAKDNKLVAFVKRQPNLSKDILYALMLFGLLLGTGRVLAGKDIKRKKKIEERKSNNENTAVVLGNPDIAMPERAHNVRPNTFGAFKEKMIQWEPDIAVLLMNMEDFRDTVYNKDSHPTIGFGNTVVDGKPVKKGMKVTMKDGYKLILQHLDAETYRYMYAYEVGIPGFKIDSKEKALLMVSPLYNGGSDFIEKPTDRKTHFSNRNYDARAEKLKELFNKFGDNVTDDMIKKLFKKYPIEYPSAFGKAWEKTDYTNESEKVEEIGNALSNYLIGSYYDKHHNLKKKALLGLAKRRWLTSEMSRKNFLAKDLLYIRPGSVYDILENVPGGEKIETFVKRGPKGTNSNKIKEAPLGDFKKQLVKFEAKEGQRIIDYLPPEAAEIIENEKMMQGTIYYTRALRRQEKRDAKKEAKYQEHYEQAQKFIDAKDYKAAAEKYQALIKEHPNNTALRNDLAFIYDELGLYKRALKQTQEILAQKDEDQHKAALYNAGLAYEGEGKLQQALANYKSALAKGNKSKDVQIAIQRVMEKMKYSKYKKGKFSNAKNKIKKSKTVQNLPVQAFLSNKKARA